MWLFLACTGTSTSERLSVQKPQVVFAQDSQQNELMEILEKQDYERKGEFLESFFYALLETEISADLAVDIRSQSYRIVHVPTGIEAKGKRDNSIQDIWNSHKARFVKKPKHIVAYGGAPWFAGTKNQRFPLTKHFGGYFFQLEEHQSVTPFIPASPFVFAGEVDGDIRELLADPALGMDCSLLGEYKHVYWCAFPELDLACVEKTQAWIDSLWVLGLKRSTEGRYRAIFQKQEIGLCLPSGCYECNGISCKNTSSSEGMPVYLNQKDWSLCLEKNFDSDPEKTRICFNQSSYANNTVGIHIDDCRR